MKASVTQRQQLDHLAWVLDSAIRIPFTRWRIGLDGLLGLIPGIGDLVAGLLSAYIVMRAQRMGASRGVLLKMLWNIVLETVIGVIPVFGDAFDFVFKANQRNVALLRNHALNGRIHDSSRGK